MGCNGSQNVTTVSHRSSRFANYSKPGLMVGGFVLAALLPIVTTNLFYVHIGNLILINAIVVVGLGVVASVGQMSLCHAAFAGLGGYISAVLATRYHFPPLIGLALAVIVPGVIATAMGAIILRLRGVYFVLVTFLLGQAFTLVALNWATVTLGANGIIGVPAISIGGFSFKVRSDFYYFALGTFSIVLLFIWALMRSNYGRAFRSIAENIQLAEASGINTSRFQVIAFAIGSAIAGIAGAISTHYTRYISPDTFTFTESIMYITMFVIGGRLSLAGAVLGAAVLTPLPELLRNFSGLQQIIYGAILIVVLFFLPGGLVSIGSYFGRKKQNWKIAK